METLVQVAQLLLALSILVGIHEGGHMVAAKMFGMKVEKFFIGFPPTLFSFKKGETEYGLGAIPLGGFVKISGMIDESMDKEQMAQPPQPWEFRSKPAWQRLIVMLGGIIVNVVAGVIAMIILTYNVGDEYIPSSYVKENGVQALRFGEQFGFQNGDKILNINGEDYERFSDVTDPAIFLDSDAYYTVERNGQQVKITVPDGALDLMSKEKTFKQEFLYPRAKFQVAYPEDPEYLATSNAKKVGIFDGDIITKVGDTPAGYTDQFKSILGAYAGGIASIEVLRGNETLTFEVPVNKDTTIGFLMASQIPVERNEYSFGEATAKGTADAFNLVIVNARAMGKMFSGDLSARSLSGPIGIVNLFPKAWDWNQFWYTTAFISMILAFMNLLPIPALDGGHVMFLLYEMISGKAPSDKFLENAQKVGMIILLALMVFVFGNDILKLFGI
ncbi:RIP metalloprotease RseP [Roseivirga pacifica]|uniref:RIP metalloprotease RseP n=1 Tax=Roseivirga pacifica TaxID=1267423 RepID=UPI0020960D46|nr:RIP metalloprotease RseP [Roseivirga pacifica]MCO6358786.1 RIP metalloprotease RseP [Roseivirga pacifica]MCO6365578.1 RIP metalloprotease RseP [Roseivirga pacifica]MCO6371692.1 RIP metalloprotease RseP [Roseivirga pacifica]MCO6376197.1 RIP metalloprotease RseP [Roseivirga pacifica]MCO6379070.1 RIP metalloprotease RseP [Roseivirga pacifica]